MSVPGGGLPAASSFDAALPVTVVRGNPTPEELAAVVACLAATMRRKSATAPRRTARSRSWARAARTGLMRAALPAGWA